MKFTGEWSFQSVWYKRSEKPNSLFFRRHIGQGRRVFVSEFDNLMIFRRIHVVQIFLCEFELSGVCVDGEE